MKLIHNKHTYRLWGSAFKTSGNRDLHTANGILKLVTESGSIFFFFFLLFYEKYKIPEAALTFIVDFS